MSGRRSGGLDPPLKKRLADLEIRRRTLIEAMSKFQDAKKSALFQHLTANSKEEVLSSSFNEGMKDECPGELDIGSVREETNEDRNCSSSRRESIQVTRHHRCSDDPPSYTQKDKATEEKVRLASRLSTTNPFRSGALESNACIAGKSSPETGKYLSSCAEKQSPTSMCLKAHWLERPCRSTERIENAMKRKTQQNLTPDTKKYSIHQQEDCHPIIDRNTNNLESSNSESPSLALSERRQTHGSKHTSYKSSLQEFDAMSTQMIENPLFHAERKDQKPVFFLDDKQAPSDESVSHHKGGGNIESQFSNENSNSREISISKDREKTADDFTCSSNDQSVEARREDDTLVELKNHNTKNNSPKVIHPQTLDRQEEKEDMENRPDTINIVKDQKCVINERREKLEIEDKFLKLFVGEEDAETTEDNCERKFMKSERKHCSDQISLEESSEGLPGRERNGVDDGDHMALLEKKLNMMISKKPLWQKALHDLYDGSFSSSKISVSTTSSVIMKLPSEADTICSIDTYGNNGQTAPELQYSWENRRKNLADFAADTIQPESTTNDEHSLAEADTLESWLLESHCSIDSPDTDALRDMTFNSQDNERIFKVETDRIMTGKSTKKGISDAAIDTIESQHIQNAKNYLDTLPESLSDLNETSTNGTESNVRLEIKNDCSQNARIDVPLDEGPMATTYIVQQYAQTVCLESNENRSIGESKVKEDRVEYDERAGYERVSNMEENAAPLDEEPIFSNVEQQRIQFIDRKLNEQTLQTEFPLLGKMENPASRHTHAEQQTCQQIVVKSKFTRTERSEINIDEEPMNSKNIEQQCVYSFPSQSKQPKEAKNESLHTVKKNNTVLRAGEQPVVEHPEQENVQPISRQLVQHIQVEVGSSRSSDCENIIIPLHKDYDVSPQAGQRCIQPMHSQPNQQNDVNIESPRTTHSKIDVPLKEELMVSTDAEQQMTHFRQNTETESPQTAERESIIIDEDETVSPQAKLHRIQSNYFEPDQWEMLDPASNLKTPPVSNARRQFFSQSDLLRDKDSTNRHYLSEGDKFGNPRPLKDKNGINHLNCLVWGVTSDLSEGPTASPESSVFSGCLSEKIENDGDNNQKNDIDVRDHEESCPKPPIPNEVTMLTDFTVQSIAYTSNSSVIESLGEESILHEIQQNRKTHVMASSNSESTIVGEKPISQQSKNALQVIKPNTTYTEGLLQIFKNPSLLCQCTGPVALSDVAWSDRKSSSNTK
jgi:hypothetical protein